MAIARSPALTVNMQPLQCTNAALVAPVPLLPSTLASSGIVAVCPNEDPHIQLSFTTLLYLVSCAFQLPGALRPLGASWNLPTVEQSIPVASRGHSWSTQRSKLNQI